jgi:glycosyltransferase involved in cell wall biosynthesis
MRIGIDYSGAVWQRAGIGRYVRLLTEALLRVDQENQYILLYPRGFPGRPAPFLEPLQRLRQDFPQVQLRPLPLSDRYKAILWQRLRLPIPLEAFCGRLDFFFSPDFVLLPRLAARRAVTIHDLAFLVHPECAVPALRAYLQRAVPRAVARADLVLAGSESVRQDVLRLLPVAPERVRVLYSGVHPSFRPLADTALLEAVRARYRLPQQYLLTVGTIEPRKNLPRLLEALAGLPAEVRLPLVVAGQPGWLYQETFTAVERLGLEVHFPGFIPDEDMPAVYNLARALAFPSIHEGFGVPPLEALACGIPVLASRAPAMPEILGEAALLIDPLDVASIREGLRRLLEDEDLRARLRPAGFERAHLFTWEAAARRLLELARGLLAG